MSVTVLGVQLHEPSQRDVLIAVVGAFAIGVLHYALTTLLGLGSAVASVRVRRNHGAGCAAGSRHPSGGIRRHPLQENPVRF